LGLVAKPMKRRDVNRALRGNGCTIKSDHGRHTTWVCPDGQHTADIPRHVNISAGVVGDTISRMKCLPEGWLQ
jgi:hypothetical protein